MEKSIVVVSIALTLVLGGLLSVPTQAGGISASLAPASAPVGSSHVGPLLGDVTPSAPRPATTFPRTVLVETFTAVWCIHCPAESQALFAIDHNTNRSVLDIAEIHVCYYPPGSGPCDENYATPGNTSVERTNFYDVPGFPDVFFDGQNSIDGASNSMGDMEDQYNSSIANASAVPANLSISQAATLSAGVVNDQANITSGVTGTFNAITYLVQYIDKQGVSNGEGPHSLAWVVREELRNHPVSLTAGQTTEIAGSGALNSTWNPENLSVITFVQDNSTKVIYNAKMAPVSAIAAGVFATPSAADSGANVTVKVQVQNLTTHDAIAGANVTLSSNGGGSFFPASGQTAANGTFSSTFTAPSVTSNLSIEISDVATWANSTGYGTTTVVVTPLVPPTVPTGLTITPGINEVGVNWSAPSSGGAGLTYFLSESTSPTGDFAMIDTTAANGYLDTNLVTGQTYWFEVDAEGPGGFSHNTPAISATSILAVAQGLPASVGWWISIDSGNFTSPTNGSLSLFLPNGDYTYAFGADWNGYIPTMSPSVPLSVSGTAYLFYAPFSPNLGTLQGTVSPTDASVTLNGSPVQVVGGSIATELQAGTYTLNVTAPGYRANTTSVVLTPGNTTRVSVLLEPRPSNTGGVSSSGSGSSNTEMYELVAAAVVIGVGAFLGVVLIMNRRNKGRPPSQT
jgi:hypothetical protein